MYLKVVKRVLHRSLTGGRAEMRENSGTAQLISAGGRRAEAQRFALPARAGYTVAVAVFVRIVHRAGATAEYNNGSDELLHGTTSSEGPARSTAELAVVGVVVGTKAHLSAIHRRSPVSQSWLHRRCAHRGARGRERRRLLFRPGALFTPEGPVHCQVH